MSAPPPRKRGPQRGGSRFYDINHCWNKMSSQSCPIHTNVFWTNFVMCPECFRIILSHLQAAGFSNSKILEIIGVIMGDGWSPTEDLYEEQDSICTGVTTTCCDTDEASLNEPSLLSQQTVMLEEEPQAQINSLDEPPSLIESTNEVSDLPEDCVTHAPRKLKRTRACRSVEDYELHTRLFDQEESQADFFDLPERCVRAVLFEEDIADSSDSTMLDH